MTPESNAVNCTKFVNSFRVVEESLNRFQDQTNEVKTSPSQNT